MESRDSFFDVLKFFCILLVIYFHVIGSFDYNGGSPYISNFIVGMNMPLFFIISGYFAAQTIENGEWRKLLRRLFSYVWPIMVVSGAFALLAVSFGLNGSNQGLFAYAARNALATWFLWCLAICFSLVFLCQRWHPLLCWGCMVAILPLLSKPTQMNSVRAMLPFFVFGAFVLRRWAIWKIWYCGSTCLFLYLLLVVFQGNIWQNGLSFYSEQTTWSFFLQHPVSIFLYLLRLLNGIMGSIGMMWLLHEGMKRLCHIRLCAPFGKTTLWVYILHAWLLARVVDLGWYNQSFFCTIAWVAILFTICHVIGSMVKAGTGVVGERIKC